MSEKKNLGKQQVKINSIPPTRMDAALEMIKKIKATEANLQSKSNQNIKKSVKK